MKDYLIRIHRPEKNNPGKLVGVVEEVGVEGNRAFSNLDQLWSILNPSKAETGKTKKRDKSLKEKRLKIAFFPLSPNNNEPRESKRSRMPVPVKRRERDEV